MQQSEGQVTWQEQKLQRPLEDKYLHKGPV